MSLRKTRMKQTPGEMGFSVCIYVFVTFMFLVTLYPLIYVLSASFSDPEAVASGEMMLWPIGFNTDGYQMVLQNRQIWIGYRNTILYTVIGTLMQLAVTLPCAYALSRRDLQGKGAVLTLFMITMYFSGGMICGYLNIKELGLLDNPLSQLLPGLVSTYNMIVARTFFANSIPWELTEASYLDGASDFKLFTKVILPLSAPIIVVLALYYGVAHWNSYFEALLYLDNRDFYPLQVFLKEILTQAQMANEFMMEGGYTPEEIQMMEEQAEMANRVKYCVIVVSTVPMMIIYPRLQKYFAKGVMIGSVKG